MSQTKASSLPARLFAVRVASALHKNVSIRFQARSTVHRRAVSELPRRWF